VGDPSVVKKGGHNSIHKPRRVGKKGSTKEKNAGVEMGTDQKTGSNGSEKTSKKKSAAGKSKNHLEKGGKAFVVFEGVGGWEGGASRKKHVDKDVGFGGGWE